VLYVALVFSSIILITAVFAARGSDPAFYLFLTFGAAFSFGTIFLMFFFPPVAVQFLCLGVTVGLLRRYPRRGQSLAAPLVCAVTFVVYAIFLCGALPNYRETQRLLASFPYESMVERVPEPGPTSRTTALSLGTERRLDGLDEQVREESRRASFRTYSLKLLHSGTVWNFVNSPGFGQTRMHRPDATSLAAVSPRNSPVPQPVPRSQPAESAAPAQPRESTADEKGLKTMHVNSVVDFANPTGFGLITDRRHVAGFDSHAFSRLPEPSAPWHVETVDLVGLLLHAEPVAYVSADLPRMDELRKAPTRPLDAFEVAGLERLQAGDDLVLAEVDSRQRMLGSLRSARQCVQCHGGERGDLLGAFSYTLHKDPGAGRK
jgi:hypothetical protein